MWVLVMFDLPTVTPAEKRAYTKFRKVLLESGFTMLQYSVYARPCASEEHALAQRRSIKRALPYEGQVRMLMLTDKQFGRMQIFVGKPACPVEQQPAQLTFFE